MRSLVVILILLYLVFAFYNSHKNWINGISKEEIVKEEIPMKRFGMPEEVSELVYFLASDKARYITGQVISPNGGSVI